MVDRDKDAGIDESRMAAERNTAGREQSITRKDEITEESRLAHKQSVVLQGPGKVCLFQFCVCACERGACRSPGRPAGVGACLYVRRASRRQRLRCVSAKPYSLWTISA
jgi:hypothetical protein